MLYQDIRPYDQITPRHGVLVADGFGIALKVDRGHLVVEDGVGKVRRTRRFPKAGHGLTRVVVLGSHGYLSLEAIRWLDRLEIPLIQVTADGQSILASTHLGLRNGRLRRAQALAPRNTTGLEISRYLLGVKVRRQADVAAELGDASPVRRLADLIPGAASLIDLLRLEAQAAAEYWALWAPVALEWVKRDQTQVPELWHHFGPRSSVVSGRGPRLAANPANAIANYLYALQENETVIACHAIGLDPQLGFFHADTPARDSLAADLMEAIRPAADAWLLNLIRHHRFARHDFVETPRGVVRLATTMTHRLAETTLTWATEIAPIAEHVVSTLLDGNAPTVLTQRRKRAAAGSNDTGPKAPAVSIGRRCADCGDVTHGQAMLCSACGDRRAAAWLPELSERASEYLARARADGRDPAHGGTAAIKRSASNRTHQLATHQWDRFNARPDPEMFRTQILPGLRTRSVKEMQAATGLSEPYCLMIRRGDYVPHPRHWQTLRRLGGSEPIA